jgi:hypothetical protein
MFCFLLLPQSKKKKKKKKKKDNFHMGFGLTVNCLMQYFERLLHVFISISWEMVLVYNSDCTKVFQVV